jgi:CubicO group peptidase (beta-lactamase class C family)
MATPDVSPGLFRSHKWLVVSALCCFLTQTAAAQRLQPAAADPVAAIAQMMQFAAEQQCFSGVLLVADKGKVLYHQGFGYADMEAKAPNTPQTVFNLGSIAKQFTAVGIMMLQEEGKLSYDDSLSRYFPQLPYRGITLRHLLHHTSGLPDYLTLLLGRWHEKWMPSNSDAIAALVEFHPPIKFKPGARHEYCNTGYMLLASVIEQVSGMPYEKFMQRRIFRPLGMKNTQIYRPNNHSKPEGLAEPYAFDLSTGTFVPTAQYPPYAKQVATLEGSYGDGGLFSSSSDLLRWDKALKTERLLQKASWEQALTGTKLNDGTPVPYGFGWFLAESAASGKFMHHTGGWPGCRQALIRYRDKDRTILVLRNNEVAFSSLQKAIEAILDGKPWEMPQTSLTYVLSLAAAQGSAADLYPKFQAMREFSTFNELEINDLGYKLLAQGKPQHALEVMKINVELFPQSANAHDSLGALYLKNGDMAQAEHHHQQAKALGQSGN